MYSVSDYLDLGFIADFCRFYKIPSYKSLYYETSFTPVDQLLGEVAPSSMCGKRAQVLMFAWTKRRADVCNSMIVAYPQDLCFQLYALCSYSMTKIAPTILAKDDRPLFELAILRLFNDTGCFDSIMQDKDVNWMLQQFAERILESRHDALASDELQIICAGSKDSDLAVNYNKFQQRYYKAKSACVKYFKNLGFTEFEFYYYASKCCIKRCSSISIREKYCNKVLDELLSMPSVWTEQEFNDVKALLPYTFPSSGVTRYQNYKRLYEDTTVPKYPILFRFGQFDTCLAEKMKLLSYDDKISAIKNTLVRYPRSITRITQVDAKAVCIPFQLYLSDLQEAYGYSREYLKPRVHPLYEIKYLESQEDLSDFVDCITQGTLKVFLAQLERKCVRDAVFSWCERKGECFRLEDYKEYYTRKQQCLINKQTFSMKQHQHPHATGHYDLVLTLQVFACEHDYDFAPLSDSQQILLAKALSTEGTVWRCVLDEEEICNATIKAWHARSTGCSKDILTCMLKYGESVYQSAYHYFVDLHGNLYDLNPDDVCAEEYRFALPEQSAADAKKFKGRSFEVNRKCSAYRDDSVLDYYQWCGSDAFSECDESCKTVKDFAKYFCKNVLGYNIDDWEIEDGSPLLCIEYLLQLDTSYDQRWLCRKGTSYAINSKLPEEAIECTHNVLEYKAAENNLLRHPLDWFKQFENWKELIVYPFDWDENTVRYYDYVKRNHLTSKKIAFCFACNTHEYRKMIESI